MLYRKESMILLFHFAGLNMIKNYQPHSFLFCTFDFVSGTNIGTTEEKVITSSTSVNQDDDNFQINVSCFIFALTFFDQCSTYVETR